MESRTIRNYVRLQDSIRHFEQLKLEMVEFSQHIDTKLNHKQQELQGKIHKFQQKLNSIDHEKSQYKEQIKDKQEELNTLRNSLSNKLDILKKKKSDYEELVSKKEHILKIQSQTQVDIDEIRKDITSKEKELNKSQNNVNIQVEKNKEELEKLQEYGGLKTQVLDDNKILFIFNNLDMKHLENAYQVVINFEKGYVLESTDPIIDTEQLKQIQVELNEDQKLSKSLKQLRNAFKQIVNKQESTREEKQGT